MLHQVQSKAGINSRQPHKYSRRVLGTLPPRKASLLAKPEPSALMVTEPSNPSKNSSLRPCEVRRSPKLAGLTELQVNLLKKRCNNINSHGLLSSTVRVNVKKEEAREYYMKDVKSSLAQFKDNEEFMDAHLTHFMESISAFQLFSCSYLPPQPHKVAELPPISPAKITLVFDLDETLVHSQPLDWQLSPEDIGWGQTVDVVTEEGKYQVNLKIRPHAVEVLRRLKKTFEIGVLTAGQPHYAKALLDQLDPEGDLFAFRLSRPYCLEMQSRVPYVKDLRVLGGRDLARTVLVDNSPHSYLFQKSNGIPIVSFYEDKEDRELLKLEEFLGRLEGLRDVRKCLQEYFRLEEYGRFSSMAQLGEHLFR
jgi:CTD small phosphatase-like protein 2